jgi:hypothetical protein
MHARSRIPSSPSLRATGGDRLYRDIETRVRLAGAGANSLALKDCVRPRRRMSFATPRRLLLSFVALSAIMTCAAFADEPLFGFLYTTDLLPKGGMEVEQWMTWRHQKNSGSYDQLEHRTEFEYGVTDQLQAALYLNYNWTQAFHNGPFGATTPPEQFADFSPGPDDHFNKSRFVGVSGELIYRILSPYTDPIGLAVYAEPTIGQNFRELETRIILQKNFFDDLLTLAFNFTYAPEFRYLPNDSGIGSSWQEETDVNLTFGASYRFVANWSAGFEFTNEREYNSFLFNHESNSGYYLGPNIHYGGEKFFVTVSALWQMPWATTHSDTVPGALVNGFIGDNDFERFRLRIKAGYVF